MSKSVLLGLIYCWRLLIHAAHTIRDMAETAAIKYAYMLSLAISTGDDPEADIQTDLSTTKQKPKATVQSSAPMQSVRKKQPLKCADCGATISDKVSSYSQKQFGRPLCIRCQHQVSHIA